VRHGNPLGLIQPYETPDCIIDLEEIQKRDLESDNHTVHQPERFEVLNRNAKIETQQIRQIKRQQREKDIGQKEKK